MRTPPTRASMGWERIDTAAVPGAGGALELLRRGPEIAIHVDGRQLMSSLAHGSEEALGELVCARLAARPAARVLIGGLGMGFTLAAVLRRVGPDAAVVVAELVPAVVRWNQGLAGAPAGRPLDDPRASVSDGDVADRIRGAAAAWDAILLDVDNGPAGLTRRSNDWLYGAEGLDATYDALRPGGVLGVWSAAPDPGFTRRLSRAGFDAEPVEVRARGPRGGRRHVIWIGLRRPEPAHWRRHPPDP